MRATHLRLQNFRSFVDSGVIELSGINVLIGANNAGKSTILRGLQQIQQGLPDLFADVRVGATEARIEIGLVGGSLVSNWITKGSDAAFTYVMQLQSSDRRSGAINASISAQSQHQNGDIRLAATEPHHFIVPYLSKRKAVGYHEDIREQHVVSIAPDVSNLAAKLSRLGNPAYLAHERYTTACKSILGFVVTAIPSTNGQRPGIYLPDGQTIPIDQLGEGVPNIVHFLASLAVSEGKLFVVEEPENDLHPQALKALLDLVVTSSHKNQFVVSTHSNIVVRHLCAVQGSHLFRLRPKSDALPIESEIERVPDSADARLAVLSELGYSLSDFELWDGWLVLEESSAERIVRDYLVPWFAPSLSRIRTIASGGASKVSTTFEDLNRLFLFTHLTPAYRESSWVLVDGDDAGLKAIEKLREKFPTYGHDRFRALTKPAFEEYYPAIFSEKARDVLAIGQESDRRAAKRQLLIEVMEWLDCDRDRGVVALAESAIEVIELLRGIEVSLKTRGG
jgi:hypothetical protein